MGSDFHKREMPDKNDNCERGLRIFGYGYFLRLDICTSASANAMGCEIVYLSQDVLVLDPRAGDFVSQV